MFKKPYIHQNSFFIREKLLKREYGNKKTVYFVDGINIEVARELIARDYTLIGYIE